MKKILSVLLVFVMVLVLSGCGETTQDLKDGFYTQEEVDLMINELQDSFDYQAMNNLNERVYELESELRDFERFEYEDLLEFEEYFYGKWLDDLEEYLGETYYTKDELDEGFEDVRLYLEDLQEQIADLQAQIDELNE